LTLAQLPRAPQAGLSESNFRFVLLYDRQRARSAFLIARTTSQSRHCLFFHDVPIVRLCDSRGVIGQDPSFHRQVCRPGPARSPFRSRNAHNSFAETCLAPQIVSRVLLIHAESDACMCIAKASERICSPIGLVGHLAAPSHPRPCEFPVVVFGASLTSCTLRRKVCLGSEPARSMATQGRSGNGPSPSLPLVPAKVSSPKPTAVVRPWARETRHQLNRFC
jgi:hypothetical protein